MMRRLFLGTSFLVATVGCSGPSFTDVLATRVLIEPDAATYAPGDTVRISLRNTGETAVDFASCPFAREQFVGVWKVTSSVRSCASIGIPSIPPGSSRVVMIEPLPGDVHAGLYRWRFDDIRVDGQRIANARSAPYRIVRP